MACTGADPGRNLTKAQPKAHGRGVAFRVGLDKRTSLKSSKSSVEYLTSLQKLRVENETSVWWKYNSAQQQNARK